MLFSYLAGGPVFAVIGAMIGRDSGGAALALGIIGGMALWSLILDSILMVNYLLVPARSRRTFAQQKALHHRVELTWSGQGVSLESAQGRSDFDWRDFVRVEQCRDIILLFQSDYLFNFVPPRALSEEQAADFIRSANLRRA